MNSETDVKLVKTWKPIHTKIALLSATGMKNIEIAELVGMTPAWICRILGDPRAERLKEAFVERLRDNLMTSMGDRIVALAEDALENIEQTVVADIDPDSARKMWQDKVSLEVLNRAGFGKNAAPRVSGGIVLSKEASDELVEAIKKSDEARRLHEGSYLAEDNERDGVGGVDRHG